MIPDNKVSEVIIDQSVTGLSSPAFAKILAARENTNLMINTVIDRNHKAKIAAFEKAIESDEIVLEAEDNDDEQQYKNSRSNDQFDETNS
jgi:hypothetical protein